MPSYLPLPYGVDRVPPDVGPALLLRLPRGRAQVLGDQPELDVGIRAEEDALLQAASTDVCESKFQLHYLYSIICFFNIKGFLSSSFILRSTE